MARTSARKGKSKGPVEPVWENGKITNWSNTWADAKELEALMLAGSLKGKAPAQIMKEHHAFQKYAYKAFSSAVTNARNKYKKQQMRLEEEAESGGIST